MEPSGLRATSEWLTRILRAAGALAAGHVIAVSSRPNNAFNSAIAHLELTLSGDAPASAPRRLLLKQNQNHDGALEVSFYRMIAEVVADVPIFARCFGAEHDVATGDSYCLLEDLSETHVTPMTRSEVLDGQAVPTDIQLAGIVDATARFHAHFWEHPRLRKAADEPEDGRPWWLQDVAKVRPWFRDDAYHQQHAERREKEWRAFIGVVGDWFPTDLRELYERALADLPTLWERYLARRIANLRHVTMSNGDSYFAQYLCPRDPEINTTRIVDFQDASANLGTYDLVYLFATFWTPEQRRENDREERLFRYYLDRLRHYGVRDYTWDDLQTDYRLMIAYMIFDPVWNQTSGSSKAYWWPKLQCLVGAYRDWECDRLGSASSDPADPSGV
jgi:hypothetical protein